MSSQSLFQSGDHRQTLLAQSGEIASDAAKGLSARQAAQAPRDFLLHFLLFERQQLGDQSLQRGLFFSKHSVFFLKSLQVVLHHRHTLLFSCPFGKGSR